MNQLAETFVQELEERSVPQKADWWNRYLKGEIRFVGSGIPEIRKLLLEMNLSEGLDRLPMNRQVSLVNGLMRSHLAEHKLAAILYVQLFWLGKRKNSFLLGIISDWFDDRYIYDWNTTDWLSVKVLAPLLDTGDRKVLWTLKQWNHNAYLWKARASLVPFAASKHLPEYSRDMARFAGFLIRRKERFAKTAVGWVLREYSKVDEDFVLDFLSKHVKYTTWEVKRNALRYYRKKVRNP
jgi:3-methyladenine DNA glycosylase AlkD